VQVGINAWMWSSGGLDDLVNHSCNPNLGLWQTGGETYLLSLRDIGTDEELSFDYSTSMVDEPWSMECMCGDALCRGTIANFLDMPDAVQQRYAERGVLPEHVWATAAARNVKLATPVPVTLGPATQAAQAAPSVETASASTEDCCSKPSRSAVHVANWGLYEKNVGDRGRGVFAGRHIPDNEIVLKFEGPIYTKETCPDFSEAIQVSYVCFHRIGVRNGLQSTVWRQLRSMLVRSRWRSRSWPFPFVSLAALVQANTQCLQYFIHIHV
jgi:hypothetical protein